MEKVAISDKNAYTKNVKKVKNIKHTSERMMIKIVIFEENGRFYFENSAMLAFERVEEAFNGEAQPIVNLSKENHI